MTQDKHPDRYVIREHSGYREATTRLVTEVMVLDSHYGYAVAWSSAHGTFRLQLWRRGRRRGTIERLWCRASLAKCRAYAETLATELNAEHEIAMLAPMQAATVGEDAQATKGKGSR